MRRVSYSEIGGRGGFNASRLLPGASNDCSGDPQLGVAPDAFQAGYEEGYRTALAEAERRQRAEAEERASVELAFARLNEAAAQTMRQRLRETVLALCEDAVAPLLVDEALLIRRIEKAVALFKRKEDERVVSLNPQDLELVRGQLGPEIVLQPDPSVPRGALRVDGPEGGVEDGPEQWKLALREALSCSS